MFRYPHKAEAAKGGVSDCGLSESKMIQYVANEAGWTLLNFGEILIGYGLSSGRPCRFCQSGRHRFIGLSVILKVERIEEHKGRRRVPKTMNHNLRLLYPHEEQALRNDPIDRPGTQRLSSWRHDIPTPIDTGRGGKQRITDHGCR